MLGFVLGALKLCLGEFSAVGCAEGLRSKSTPKSMGAVRSTLVPPLMSKKSVLRKAEKSSLVGCGSASASVTGDSWFKFAMYWDTLGPRGPLYPDIWWLACVARLHGSRGPISCFFVVVVEVVEVVEVAGEMETISRGSFVEPVGPVGRL